MIVATWTTEFGLEQKKGFSSRFFYYESKITMFLNVYQLVRFGVACQHIQEFEIKSFYFVFIWLPSYFELK